MADYFAGEFEITIRGKVCTLVYDWKAIAQIRTEFGDKVISDLFGTVMQPEKLARVLVIGLQKKHPEITAEQLSDGSLPYVPAVKLADNALAWAYFGKEPPKKTTEPEKKSEKPLSQKAKSKKKTS